MIKNYPGHTDRGVTFIEVVISLLLLGVVAGSIIGVFVISKASAIRAKHRACAINLAREKIEMIKAVDYSEVSAQAGVEAVAIDMEATGTTGQRTTVVSDVYGNSMEYKVTSTVTWIESASFEEKVITLISQH